MGGISGVIRSSVEMAGATRSDRFASIVGCRCSLKRDVRYGQALMFFG